MTSSKWFLGLGFALCAACTPASGALGPQGYEQSLTKYRLNYADAANQKFLLGDWVLDNYSYDQVARKWTEKKGVQYRAERQLDEDGDGTISSAEKKSENIFDLRFVNSRDNAVIWLKVHPLQATYANVDLDVILEDYADGLEGTGLFEQSTLFGLVHDKARHFTTFMVKKEPTMLGPLPAIRGVVEIADVEKLRLDAAHRDSKAELLFAKVTYLEKLGIRKPTASRWPIVTEIGNQGHTVYSAQRTGLLVIGYYDDASRFESHVADLHALLDQIEVPASAIPPNATPLVLPKAPASAAPAPKATEATEATEAAATAPATSAAKTATVPAPAAIPPTASAATSVAATAVPAPTTSPVSKAPPAASIPVPSAAKK